MHLNVDLDEVKNKFKYAFLNLIENHITKINLKKIFYFRNMQHPVIELFLLIIDPCADTGSIWLLTELVLSELHTLCDSHTWEEAVCDKWKSTQTSVNKFVFLRWQCAVKRNFTWLFMWAPHAFTAQCMWF